MMRPVHPLHGLLACCLLAAGVTPAAAHCCHDQRSLGIAEQSELRRGLHGLNDGITDDSVQSNPPTTGNGLGRGGPTGIGGLGQMRGKSLGAYGAGSLGEPGPGGLGALRGDGLGAPPARPR